METYQHTVALFKEYKAENDKRKIVELLESFLRECPDADDMQICWAFWNLSDNYAKMCIRDRGYTVADSYTAFENSGADLVNAGANFSVDPHPNRAGHELLAETHAKKIRM